MKNEFATTKDLFASYTNFTRPLSYGEWCNLPHDHKAAVLYCQFYEQITLAWFKLASVYSVEADGVAEVLQYLEKNVPVIIKDSKRFTPSYIYKVVYNCLYCLCRDPNKYKQAYENETSNIQSGNEGHEFDLFDTVGVDEDFSRRDKDAARDAIWKAIEKLGSKDSKNGSKDVIIVVSQILGDNIDFTGTWLKPDFRDPEGPKESDIKVYKLSEEVSPARVEIREAAIRKQYGDSIVSEFEHIQKVSSSGKVVVVLKWSVRKEREYKGYRAFSKRDIDKVTPERRAEILSQLAEILAPYKDIF